MIFSPWIFNLNDCNLNTYSNIHCFSKKLFFSLDPRLFRKLSIFFLRNATNLTLRTFSGVRSWILYLVRNYILHNWNVLLETSFFNVQTCPHYLQCNKKYWEVLILLNPEDFMFVKHICHNVVVFLKTGQHCWYQLSFFMLNKNLSWIIKTAWIGHKICRILLKMWQAHLRQITLPLHLFFCKPNIFFIPKNKFKQILVWDHFSIQMVKV